jgi:ribonuclease H2 subunit B
MPLEQCLRDEDYPETNRLIKCQNLKLSLVADRKGDESLQAFKYNEEKTLSWLRKKVERVAEIVRQKGIHVSQGAISANYVKSSKYEGGTEAGNISINVVLCLFFPLF